jgi:hypothetical protein
LFFTLEEFTSLPAIERGTASRILFREPVVARKTKLAGNCGDILLLIPRSLFHSSTRYQFLPALEAIPSAATLN